MRRHLWCAIGAMALGLVRPVRAYTQAPGPATSAAERVVTFPSGALTLHGVVYKPAGPGPFPAVVYNHGSAPGMLSKEAFDALGPVFRFILPTAVPRRMATLLATLDRQCGPRTCSNSWTGIAPRRQFSRGAFRYLTSLRRL